MVHSTPPAYTIEAFLAFALLDLAGIRRAIVLSLGYQYGNPNRPAIEHEYERVKTENDWTSQQVAAFPDRLRGFCGINRCFRHQVLLGST